MTDIERIAELEKKILDLEQDKIALSRALHAWQRFLDQSRESGHYRDHLPASEVKFRDPSVHPKPLTLEEAEAVGFNVTNPTKFAKSTTSGNYVKPEFK